MSELAEWDSMKCVDVEIGFILGRLERKQLSANEPRNDARVLFHRRFLSRGLLGLSCALELIIETFRRGNVGHATANEKIFVLPKRLRGPIRDAWRSGIKCEKQNCMFSAIDSLNERFHVGWTLLIFLTAAGFRRIW